MSNTTAEILTAAINELRAQKMNDAQIASDFLGGAIAVLVEGIGKDETANFLRSFADRVEKEPGLDNVVN
jgi:hypothetical protein